MGDEAQKDEGAEPVVAQAQDGASGETAAAASSGAAAGRRMLHYSPPKLTSLGKVAELTFLKSQAGGEGGATRTHTG
jgi:hypothetical protein